MNTHYFSKADDLDKEGTQALQESLSNGRNCMVYVDGVLFLQLNVHENLLYIHGLDGIMAYPADIVLDLINSGVAA